MEPSKEETELLSHLIDESCQGQRLDAVVAQVFPDYSRTRLQAWIKQGLLQLDGETVRETRRSVQAGQEIRLRVCPTNEESRLEPQPISLDVVFENAGFLVINKPKGLVVHPGAGQRQDTLVNGLLHLDSKLGSLPRAGLIHRLDKDTTGLLLVAKNEVAYRHLAAAMASRKIEREYLALVRGIPIAGGVVDVPLRRHPVQRTLMAVSPGRDGSTKSREAQTSYLVRERFRAHSELELKLGTGRTHQIRVHMAWIGHPVVGDKKYGGRPVLPPSPTPVLSDILLSTQSQALHAYRLRIPPTPDSEEVELRIPPHHEYRMLRKALQEDLWAFES